MARDPRAASSSSSGRSRWPVTVHRLGEEAGDDLSATTTAEERLAMMWPLAVEAWTLAGRAMPGYTRNATPVSLRPWSKATSFVDADRGR